MTGHHVSPNLRRHGDSQEVLQWAFLVLAFGFWAAAKAKESPIMPSEVYGAWVVSIDAEIWAGSIMLAASLFLMGIIINGRWRWSPLLRLCGALWHVGTLGIFAISAAGSEYGDFMTLAAGVFCGVHAWFFALNLADFRWALKRNDRT